MRKWQRKPNRKNRIRKTDENGSAKRIRKSRIGKAMVQVFSPAGKRRMASGERNL